MKPSEANDCDALVVWSSEPLQMMRIDGGAPGACGATEAARAGRAIHGEARGGLARELGA